MTAEMIKNKGLFSGKKIIVVHGYMASPLSHWFPWLKEILTEQGAEVIIPLMPESSAPKPEAWASELMDTVPQIDSNTIFVGHSLGCITFLRHLEAVRSGTLHIGGYILVAGFDCTQVTLPELDLFTTGEPLNYAFLRAITEHRVSIISSNDDIVSPQASHALASSLETEVIDIDGAGHFLDREGFTRLLPVYETLKIMVSE